MDGERGRAGDAEQKPDHEEAYLLCLRERASSEHSSEPHFLRRHWCHVGVLES